MSGVRLNRAQLAIAYSLCINDGSVTVEEIQEVPSLVAILPAGARERTLVDRRGRRLAFPRRR